MIIPTLDNWPHLQYWEDELVWTLGIFKIHCMMPNRVLSEDYKLHVPRVICL